MSDTFPISVQLAPLLFQLQQKLSQSLQDADYSEQQKRRAYESGMTTNAQNRVNTLRSNRTNIVDRGLGRSGIALKNEADTNTAFDLKNAALVNTLTTDLADLARRRLNAQNDYEQAKADLLRQTAGMRMV